jgi:hypothetical protein
MAAPQPTHVPDKFPRVDGSVSISEDLDFQRRWWKFQRIAWFVLVAVLIADALGVFGQGWLSHAQRSAPDGTLHLRYDRIERAGAPSEIVIEFGKAAVINHQVNVFASQNIVKELGAQRIIPEPRTSQVGPGGLTYTFPAVDSPATVSIALQPVKPGLHKIELSVPGSMPVHANILVLP